MTVLRKTVCTLLLFLALAPLLACVPQQRRTDELLTEVGRTSSTPIANVLLVRPTTGAETKASSIWDPPGAKFDNEEFFQLLLGSIQQSGLFKEVTTEPPGDYELRSEIIFQETVPAYSSTFLLLIRYELTDVRSQRVIWKENLYSQRDFTAKQAFAGTHNVVLLMEEAYIANLENLIDRLGTAVGP